MKAKAAVAEVLAARGVTKIFGNPGSTELPFLAGLPSGIDYVLALQEASVAAMATGYTLAGGGTAIVSLHSAPGLGNAAGALHNAYSSHVPLVVIVGQQDTRHNRREPLLWADIEEFGRPLAKASFEPRRPRDLAWAVEKAFRIAETGTPGPVVLSVPMDYFYDESDPAAVGERAPWSATLSPDALADRLASDKTTVAIVTGARVEIGGAWDEAVHIADLVDADVYSAPFEPLLGFPTSHPRFKHQLPMTTAAISNVLSKYSEVVLLGAPAFTVYPYTPEPALADGVALTVISDIVEHGANLEVPGASSLYCAIKPTLAKMIERIEGAGTSRRRLDASGPRQSLADLGELNDVGPVSVSDACKIIGAIRPESSVLVDEAISSSAVVNRYWKSDRPASYLRASDGGLGFGVPAAVGAALADPSRSVTAVVGDGSFFYSPQALYTAASFGLPVKIVVLNNGGYKILHDFHGAVAGHLGEPLDMHLPGLDPTAVANGLGVSARTADSPAAVAHNLRWLYDTDGPAVVNIDMQWSDKSMFA